MNYNADEQAAHSPVSQMSHLHSYPQYCFCALIKKTFLGNVYTGYPNPLLLYQWFNGYYSKNSFFKKIKIN